LQAQLDDVLAEQDDRARIAQTDSHCDQISQLTPGELDRYAAQLARCLKALATTAPIRAHVQDELAAVRAEQDARPTADAPAEPAASTTPTG